MARLNAAASPSQALESGFYVPPPETRSIAAEIAGRLELRPGTTHLVVGGVGSGKSTELLAAKLQLDRDSETHSVYIDVSKQIDLADFHRSSLGPAIANSLGQLTYSRNDLPASEVTDLARKLFELWVGPGALGYTVEEVMARYVVALRQQAPNIVVFVDSLDRLVDAVEFECAVRDTIPLLCKHDIGFVLVGPLRILYGAERSVVDLFDQFYRKPYYSTAVDGPGIKFLTSVLRKRVPAALISDTICILLAIESGGVLRDMIALALAAVEEAYIGGSEMVLARHVEAAVEAFGRKHLIGIDSEELNILQRVRTQRTFVHTSDKDLALLVTRRVLEYQDSNGKTLYAVHPTIAPLLKQIAGEP